MSDGVVRDALVVLANGRRLCNCSQAYASTDGGCQWGCSTNQINAKKEIARAFLAVRAQIAKLEREVLGAIRHFRDGGFGITSDEYCSGSLHAYQAVADKLAALRLTQGDSADAQREAYYASAPVGYAKVQTDAACGMCGGRMVTIRGRYPKSPERVVCPTCLADRIEQVREIASDHRADAKGGRV